MRFKPASIFLALSLSLMVAITSEIMPIYADDGEQQPSQEQKTESVINDQYLVDIISTSNPEDDVNIDITLKIDPEVEQRIEAIKQDCYQDENQIWAMQKKYNNDVARYVGEQMRKILDYLRSKQITYIGWRAYSKMQNNVIKKIEQLPGSEIIEYPLGRYGGMITVKTKVSNVEAIARIPDVIHIRFARRAVLSEPYVGLQLIVPNNGCLGCPMKSINFSWLPYKDATKYKFVLAKDPTLSYIIKEAEVTTTAYEYDGTLDYGTNYFWRVMAVEPTPYDWSGTFSFQTEAKAAPQTITWKMAILVLIGIALAAASGAAIWLILGKRQKIKS